MDSLILGGLELLGTTTNPEYRLGQGLDFGAPEPDQATISSILLDGDVISGDRYRNRTINLSVRVFSNLDPRLVTTAQIRSALTAYCDTLAQAVAAKTFTLQWTPDGGLPVVFDCYRATATRQRSIVGDNQQVTLVTLTFQAKPFGRSPAMQVTAATAGASLEMDAFDSATGLTGAVINNTIYFDTPGSAQITFVNHNASSSNFGYSAPAAPVARAFSVTQDLTGAAAVRIRVRFAPSRAKIPADAPPQDVTTVLYAWLTLTSAAGNVTLTPDSWQTYSNGNTTWKVYTYSLAAVGSLDLAAVTGHSITFRTQDQFNTGVWTAGTTLGYLDEMEQVPASAVISTTTHGAVLTLPSVIGSARAPVSLAVTNLVSGSPSTFSAFLVHTPPSTQDPDVAILVSLSSASADQTVTIPPGNSRYAGTYALALGVVPGGGSVTATVTVTQLENGTAAGSATVISRTYTSGPDLIPVGLVTLPLYAVPILNSLTSFTIRVQISGADRYTEVMLLDTTGQTVWTDSNFITAKSAVFIDEPSALQSGPSIYGSVIGDRTDAYSEVAHCATSGGPLLFEPGDNKLLAWVSAGTPIVAATYYPRWLDERTG